MTDPRNISPRSDAFLSILGPYISAIEHHLHSAPYLVKGCTPRQRDAKMQPFLDGHTFVESDYSRFDMTISYDWLKCVQDQILCSYFPNDPWFSMCLDLAAETFGISQSGLAYHILGTRCSGDAHTSIANGIINHFNTWFVLEDYLFHSIHEGDDGLIAFDSANAGGADRIQLFDCMGFKIKTFVTTDFEQTSFCGRFLTRSPSNTVVSYCDPLRTLSKFHITCSPGDPSVLLLAKALSYNYTDGHTPIIGPICRAIIEVYGTERNMAKAMPHVASERFLLREVRLKESELTGETVIPHHVRISFALRTGISISRQMHWESQHIASIRALFPVNMPSIEQDELEWYGLDREVHYMPTIHCM